jgi:thiosulfate/3-mercaptopyruvate sulfurtransferase
MKLMNHGSNVLRTLIRLLMITTVVSAVALVWAQGPAKPVGTEDVLPPGSPALIQPQELVESMKTGHEQPVVLYVGPKSFWAQAHIPGASYIGPVAKPEGIETLRARIAQLPKTKPVVIYCGCCPFDHCPNIRPAFAELKKEGFTKVRVLYLPTSFGVDWKEKGLPVASGE